MGVGKHPPPFLLSYKPSYMTQQKNQHPLGLLIIMICIAISATLITWVFLKERVKREKLLPPIENTTEK